MEKLKTVTGSVKAGRTYEAYIRLALLWRVRGPEAYEVSRSRRAGYREPGAKVWDDVIGDASMAVRVFE